MTEIAQLILEAAGNEHDEMLFLEADSFFCESEIVPSPCNNITFNDTSEIL